MNDPETEVFSDAIVRLKIKTTDAPRLFGVTRQTLSSWTKGKSKIPKAAFVTLLAMENAAAQKARERVEHIDTLAKIIGRINQAENGAAPVAPDQADKP